MTLAEARDDRTAQKVAGMQALGIFSEADGCGGMDFDLPVPVAAIERHIGTVVDVDAAGLRFKLMISRQMRLPLACATFEEARELAMTVSIQIMSALLRSRQDEAPSHGPSLRLRIATPAPGARPRAHASPEAGRPATFALLFERWRLAHLAGGGAPTTPPYWKVLMERFVAFLGHDRPEAVTAQDIRAYRDHLIGSGRRLRTARHSDFAALRALFAFGVENALVPANPTAGVRFRTERLAAARSMQAFSAEEARAILTAADGQTIAARRWIPWLTALTGSRVAAIANLRRQDVVRFGGIWCLRISRQAGPIKTAASERMVPIHPAVLERGFIAFVEGLDRHRLFVGERTGAGAGPGDDGEAYHPARSTVRRLTEWLHGLGLDIGRAARKDPNHAWRHWFKEQAFAAGVPEKITDAIVGHAQATTARRYGSVSLAAMARELEKIQSPVPWRGGGG